MRALRLLCSVLCLAMLAPALGAQTNAAASSGAVLQSIAARASVVFAGEVLAIERLSGAVAITFRVDTALKGAPGATYTLREWPGLWSAGQRRYFAGERAVFFLQAPLAPNGFASPVDGLDGVLPLTAGASSQNANVDASRLATRVQRASGAVASVSPALSVQQVALAVRTAEGTAIDVRPQPLPSVQTPVVRPAPVIVRPVRMPEVADALQ